MKDHGSLVQTHAIRNCLCILKDKSLLISYLASLNATMESIVPKDSLLLDIAEKIGSQWKDLGRKLEILEETLSNISHNYNKVEEMANEMLLTWRRTKGKNAAVKMLVDNLIEIGRRDVGEYLQGSIDFVKKDGGKTVLIQKVCPMPCWL